MAARLIYVVYKVRHAATLNLSSVMLNPKGGVEGKGDLAL